MSPERKEVVEKQPGRLVIITGMSGSGKDTIINELLDRLEEDSYHRLVTFADRSPRPNETDGVDYNFCTPSQLDKMFEEGKLVEVPIRYGSSRKATPREPFEKVLHGENLIWRIEPTLAAKVLSGEFFASQFDESTADTLMESTVCIFLTVDNATLNKRRTARDGEIYNRDEYQNRDNQDNDFLKTHQNIFTHQISNDGSIDQTVDRCLEIIASKPSVV